MVRVLQRAMTTAIVAVIVVIGILWSATALLYLGGAVLRLGGLIP